MHNPGEDLKRSAFVLLKAAVSQGMPQSSRAMLLFAATQFCGFDDEEGECSPNVLTNLPDTDILGFFLHIVVRFPIATVSVWYLLAPLLQLPAAAAVVTEVHTSRPDVM